MIVDIITMAWAILVMNIFIGSLSFIILDLDGVYDAEQREGEMNMVWLIRVTLMWIFAFPVACLWFLYLCMINVSSIMWLFERK